MSITESGVRKRMDWGESVRLAAVDNGEIMLSQCHALAVCFVVAVLVLTRADRADLGTQSAVPSSRLISPRKGDPSFVVNTIGKCEDRRFF